jgi:hypothetical protein
MREKQRNTIELRKDSRIKSVPLMKYKKGENIIIGTYDYNSSFVKTSDLGVEAIELLNKGHCVGNVQQIMSEKYCKEISIKSLILTLHDANLISAFDDTQLYLPKKRSPLAKSALPKISRYLFSKTAYVLYAGICCLAIFCAMYRPILLSNLGEYLKGHYIQYAILAIFIGWLLTLKHEFFHYLAALSLGVPAHIRLGTRYFLVVMETDVSGLYMTEKFKRYKVYLAGMISDLLTIGCLICIKAFLFLNNIQTGQAAIFIDIVIAFSLFGILFQFNIFLKTDLYFVLADFINIENLYTKSDMVIKSFLRFKAPKEREQMSKAVILFSVFRFLNYVILTTIFVLGVAGMILLFILQIMGVNVRNITNISSENMPNVSYSLVSTIFYFTIFIIAKMHHKRMKQRKPIVKILF